MSEHALWGRSAGFSVLKLGALRLFDLGYCIFELEISPWRVNARAVCVSLQEVFLVAEPFARTAGCAHRPRQ